MPGSIFLLLALALSACEFNAAIQIRPQSLIAVESLGGCPHSGVSPPSIALDLAFVSDLDRMVEQGARITRGLQDHCTVGVDLEEDPDGCEPQAFVSEARLSSSGGGEGLHVSLGAGPLRWCDVNGVCDNDSRGRGPIHVGVIVNQTAEADALDPERVRFLALEELVTSLFCVSDPVSFPGCPFGPLDEFRLWSWVGGVLYEDPSAWTKQVGEALESIDSQRRKPHGEASSMGELAQAMESVASRARKIGGHGVLILLTAAGEWIPLGNTTPPSADGASLFVISLNMSADDNGLVRTLACSSGGTYQTIASATEYVAALRTLRYGLRGRWRTSLVMDAPPSLAGFYRVRATMEASVTDGPSISNPDLAFDWWVP